MISGSSSASSSIRSPVRTRSSSPSESSTLTCATCPSSSTASTAVPPVTNDRSARSRVHKGRTSAIRAPRAATDADRRLHRVIGGRTVGYSWAGTARSGGSWAGTPGRTPLRSWCRPAEYRAVGHLLGGRRYCTREEPYVERWTRSRGPESPNRGVAHPHDPSPRTNGRPRRPPIGTRASRGCPWTRPRPRKAPWTCDSANFGAVDRYCSSDVPKLRISIRRPLSAGGRALEQIPDRPAAPHGHLPRHPLHLRRHPATCGATRPPAAPPAPAAPHAPFDRVASRMVHNDGPTSAV
jgi:hypothetical protein